MRPFRLWRRMVRLHRAQAAKTAPSTTKKT